MKNSLKIDGYTQDAETIAIPTNNIHYVVSVNIIHHDENRDVKPLVNRKTVFKDASAIRARQSAFSYGYMLSFVSEKEGGLYKDHIDNYYEVMFKQMKNVNILFLSIDCINEETGEDITISECSFDNPPEDDCIENCVTELQWYKDFGYDTEGRTIKVKDHGRKQKILDYQMV